MASLCGADRAGHLVHQRVVGVDASAGELPAWPGDLDRVLAKPGMSLAGVCDVFLEGSLREGRCLVQQHSETPVGDEQVRHAARPVPCTHGADGDAVREGTAVEERVRVRVEPLPVLTGGGTGG